MIFCITNLGWWLQPVCGGWAVGNVLGMRYLMSWLTEERISRCLNSLLNSLCLPLEEQWDVYGYRLSSYNGQIIVSAWVVSLECLKKIFPFFAQVSSIKDWRGHFCKNHWSCLGILELFPFLVGNTWMRYWDYDVQQMDWTIITI